MRRYKKVDRKGGNHPQHDRTDKKKGREVFPGGKRSERAEDERSQGSSPAEGDSKNVEGR